jgi:hypothetical protein
MRIIGDIESTKLERLVNLVVVLSQRDYERI